jgi:hypothetical protein
MVFSRERIPNNPLTVVYDRRMREMEAELEEAMSKLRSAEVRAQKAENDKQRARIEFYKMLHLLEDILKNLNGDMVSVWRKHEKLLRELGYGDPNG